VGREEVWRGHVSERSDLHTACVGGCSSSYVPSWGGGSSSGPPGSRRRSGATRGGRYLPLPALLQPSSLPFSVSIYAWLRLNPQRTCPYGQAPSCILLQRRHADVPAPAHALQRRLPLPL